VFEGEGITQRMHTDCEEVTHNWREDDWESRDEHGFREEKAAFFANAHADGERSDTVRRDVGGSR
jgi:hypothetical protein